MELYRFHLTFHDNLFYETRTMGRLYETGRLLHNIALSYALGLAQTSYHQAEDVPRYAEELEGLNARGVYVLPAQDVELRYVLHTFKYGEEQTSVFMAKRNDNLPTFGRAKEIAVGSQFRFGILSEVPLDALPRWVRMGLWMSKARLELVERLALHAEGPGEYLVSAYPLNPQDMPPLARLKLFDLVSMRPSNLAENALIDAPSWWVGRSASGETVRLPQGLQYRIPQERGKAKARA